ncbi:hypothetical protein Rsub_05584 [Raphidocelis subcapitata]|uniref:AB hydrolase-1 domain-containing protein n=1 Tax=Raphidocelis subcapitata TaxID=307507 RepID=A0A2V0P0D6_9CHLO|nr:hypothetical protein Rsub_05584 [Raphidocelis subcapitata]|eukprot:GBF92382.1 hypothetical protein Rsub_05584 [Raphidocelis subcapitata]
MGRAAPPAAAAAEPAAAAPAAEPTADAAAAAAEAAALIESCSRSHALPDGRELAYVDCGGAGSRGTVLFLHPVQGNRLMALALHRPAAELGLRVIAPDRPGYGASSPHPGRTVASFAADLAVLLKALGVARVGVLGSSAGSMYAFALARNPETAPIVAGRVTLLPPWLPPSSLPDGHGVPWPLRLLSAAPVAAAAAFVGAGNALVLWRLRGGDVRVADIMTRSTPLEVAAFERDPLNDHFYRAMINEWSRPGAASAIAEEMLLCAEAGARRRLGFAFSEAAAAGAGARVFAGGDDPLVPAARVRAWAEAANGGAAAEEAAAGAAAARGGNGGASGRGGGGQPVELVVVEGGTHDGVFHTHKRAALEALAAELA